MSRLIVVQQSSTPTSPSAGDLALFANNATVPQLRTLNPAGQAVTQIDSQSLALNGSTAAVAAAFASDTYLAGSNVILAAGNWKVGGQYHCNFDMVKTGAGTAAFTITVRMGTLGTTGDASVLSLAFAVGTGVVDTGLFDVFLNFRAVGGGTSAIIQGCATCMHHLAATGLITTGVAGFGLILATSSGFNSTTPTNLGLSINGGASFSGTNTFVQTEYAQS